MRSRQDVASIDPPSSRGFDLVIVSEPKKEGRVFAHLPIFPYDQLRQLISTQLTN